MADRDDSPEVPSQRRRRVVKGTGLVFAGGYLPGTSGEASMEESSRTPATEGSVESKQPDDDESEEDRPSVDVAIWPVDELYDEENVPGDELTVDITPTQELLDAENAPDDDLIADELPIADGPDEESVPEDEPTEAFAPMEEVEKHLRVMLGSLAAESNHDVGLDMNVPAALDAAKIEEAVRESEDVSYFDVIAEKINEWDEAAADVNLVVCEDGFPEDRGAAVGPTCHRDEDGCTERERRDVGYMANGVDLYRPVAKRDGEPIEDIEDLRLPEAPADSDLDGDIEIEDDQLELVAEHFPWIFPGADESVDTSEVEENEEEREGAASLPLVPQLFYPNSSGFAGFLHGCSHETLHQLGITHGDGEKWRAQGETGEDEARTPAGGIVESVEETVADVGERFSQALGAATNGLVGDEPKEGEAGPETVADNSDGSEKIVYNGAMGTDIDAENNRVRRSMVAGEHIHENIDELWYITAIEQAESEKNARVAIGNADGYIFSHASEQGADRSEKEEGVVEAHDYQDPGGLGTHVWTVGQRQVGLAESEMTAVHALTSNGIGEYRDGVPGLAAHPAGVADDIDLPEGLDAKADAVERRTLTDIEGTHIDDLPDYVAVELEENQGLVVEDGVVQEMTDEEMQDTWDEEAVRERHDYEKRGREDDIAAFYGASADVGAEHGLFAYHDNGQKGELTPEERPDAVMNEFTSSRVALDGGEWGDREVVTAAGLSREAVTDKIEDEGTVPDTHLHKFVLGTDKSERTAGENASADTDTGDDGADTAEAGDGEFTVIENGDAYTVGTAGMTREIDNPVTVRRMIREFSGHDEELHLDEGRPEDRTLNEEIHRPDIGDENGVQDEEEVQV